MTGSPDDGEPAFNRHALASSAYAYRRFGLRPARIEKIAAAYRDELLSDTAAWLRQVARTMREQRREEKLMAEEEAAANAPETPPAPPWGGGHRPFVHLRTDGADIFALIGRCQRMAHAAGKTSHDIQIFTRAALDASSDKDAKAVIERWFQVTWEDLS